MESRTATQDLGTGARTYVAAIVAEELGLQVDQVKAVIGDSRLPMNVASGGSVTTGSSAPAIKHAAHLAREALEGRLAEALGAEAGGFTWANGSVYVTEDPARKMTWRGVCAMLQEPLEVEGSFQAQLHGGDIHGAQAALVEVDTLTGRVFVEKSNDQQYLESLLRERSGSVGVFIRNPATIQTAIPAAIIFRLADSEADE